MPFSDPEAKRAWRRAYNKTEHAKRLRAAWLAKHEGPDAKRKAVERERRRLRKEFCDGIRASLAAVQLRA